MVNTKIIIKKCMEINNFYIIKNELGWEPLTLFDEGIKKTIKWYLDNKEWWTNIINGEYKNYYKKMYGDK